jgi:hypothetical protein
MLPACYAPHTTLPRVLVSAISLRCDPRQSHIQEQDCGREATLWHAAQGAQHMPPAVPVSVLHAAPQGAQQIPTAAEHSKPLLALGFMVVHAACAFVRHD